MKGVLSFFSGLTVCIILCTGIQQPSSSTRHIWFVYEEFLVNTHRCFSPKSYSLVEFGIEFRTKVKKFYLHSFEVQTLEALWFLVLKYFEGDSHMEEIFWYTVVTGSVCDLVNF